MDGAKGAECRHFTVVCLSHFDSEAGQNTVMSCEECNTCKYCGKVVEE